MIRIKNLNKSFSSASGSVEVFKNFNISCESHKITTFVGPSGCGKTTLLNLIAGLETPDSGNIEIDLSPQRRMAYVLQDVVLLPWRTLSENARLGAEILYDKVPNGEKNLVDYFSLFDLADATQSYPATSSGGMKRRVALIRTLLTEPSLLLLDEPFVDLDFDIRLKIQRQLIKYHKKNQTTILLVTHDIEDAIALSDTVIVLSEKPTTIKTEIRIDLGTSKKDPVEARKSPKFRDYFVQIWDELKYLDNND